MCRRFDPGLGHQINDELGNLRVFLFYVQGHLPQFIRDSACRASLGRVCGILFVLCVICRRSELVVC